MIFQGAHHVHNGRVHAAFGLAVVNVVIAVHHAQGKGIQLSGVLAQLAHGVANHETRQDHGNQKRHAHKNKTDDPRRGICACRVFAQHVGPLHDKLFKITDGRTHARISRVGLAGQQDNGPLRLVFPGQRKGLPGGCAIFFPHDQIRLKGLFPSGGDKQAFKPLDVFGNPLGKTLTVLFVFPHLFRIGCVNMQDFPQAVFRGGVVDLAHQLHERHLAAADLAGSLVQRGQLKDEIDSQPRHEYGQHPHAHGYF